ncbi:cation/cationic drug transporter [Stutzerimonas stutzeri RCH2]|uniref:Cation/cationic drug transporter n=1 Tax=Stutzerimonas stutzeri RCH2 TaxID=644801 RepID=L0GGF6_STUST|nr:cation/cationic drug transporter [Stutzerimonas stutzeri RCH2]
MSGYVYLAIAICAEVVATTSMKALAGFSRPLPLLLVVTGYSLSFWMLALVVKTIPVGIAYAIWAGLGIVLVSIAAAVLSPVSGPAGSTRYGPDHRWRGGHSAVLRQHRPLSTPRTACSYTARPFPRMRSAHA